MGWLGIVMLGVVVGWLGWRLHPLRDASRVGPWSAMLIGLIAASIAKMAANVTGFFYDGDTLEWPICMAAALFAVAVTAGLVSRR